MKQTWNHMPRRVRSIISWKQQGALYERLPRPQDILSIFTGLRPLAAHPLKMEKRPKRSRGDIKSWISDGGLVTLTGGKWTTYRKMGEDVVFRAHRQDGLRKKVNYRTFRYTDTWKMSDFNDPSAWYGQDREEILNLIQEDPGLGELISEEFTITRSRWCGLFVKRWPAPWKIVCPRTNKGDSTGCT